MAKQHHLSVSVKEKANEKEGGNLCQLILNSYGTIILFKIYIIYLKKNNVVFSIKMTACCRQHMAASFLQLAVSWSNAIHRVNQFSGLNQSAR